MQSARGEEGLSQGSDVPRAAGSSLAAVCRKDQKGRSGTKGPGGVTMGSDIWTKTETLQTQATHSY